MTINPVLSQWETNEQVKGAQGQEELGHWLRETEGRPQAWAETRQDGWQVVAVTLSGVFALILILLV
jgi:hypothetical protein